MFQPNNNIISDSVWSLSMDQPIIHAKIANSALISAILRQNSSFYDNFGLRHERLDARETREQDTTRCTIDLIFMLMSGWIG